MATAGSDQTSSTFTHPSGGGVADVARVWVLARIRAVAHWLRTGPWLFVLLAAVGPLWWGRPYGELLFGQDSTRLFQPFSFNVSPLVPYSYLFSSTFPVPDFTPYFYVDATLRVLGVLGSPAWLSERLVIAIFAGLAAAGVVYLLRAIDAARDHPVRSSALALGVGALVYVYNPFTLSVTFWHIEGWTLFLAFLPWVAALAVRVIHEPTLPIRFAAVVTLLGIYLAPGVISSFAVPVALVVLWALIAVWLTAISRPFDWRRRLSKTALLLAVGAGVEGWSFAPFLAIPNIAYTSNNYVTPENLLATYSQASGTWGPFPVLTLTAFSWLLRTPSAYPWIGWLPAIAAAAVIFPVIVLLGVRRLPGSPGALLVYAVGLSALPFFVSAISPLTELQIHLLHLGGPFLVIVAGYYILAPVYLLVVVVGLHETFRRGSRLPEPVRPAEGATPRSVRWRAAVRAMSRPSGVATIAVALLLVVSAFPFALGEVYQTHGPNADAVNVPSSYESLGDFLGTPSTGADYYVLVIPMSDQNGVYLNLSGRQFLDTANLIASFIPYPLLETNNGPTAAAIEDLLARGAPANLAAVLENLHIRYVVDDPFANGSAASMNEAPNGAPIDYAALRLALPSALGSPSHVGAFEVYPVPKAIPLGWATSQLVGVSTPTDAGTLAFVGAVTAGLPGWTSALGTALWSPDGSLPGWRLQPSPVSGTTGSLRLPPGDSATIVDTAGTWGNMPCSSGNCTANGTIFDWSGSTVTARGPVERTTDRPGDYLTSTPPSSSGYCGTSGSTVSLSASGVVTGPAFLTANLTLSNAAPNNWATVQLTDGNLTLQMQAYQSGTTGPAIISLAALNRSVPYAWHNVNLPADLPDGVPWSMTLEWNATSASATLSAGNSTTASWLLFGDRMGDATNPGFYGPSAPSGPVTLTHANESIALSGGAFCLRSANVGQRAGVSYLVATGPGAPISTNVRAVSSETSSGDFQIDASGARYAVLGYPYTPLWTASAAVPLTEVSGAPFANVVALNGSGNGTIVTMHFHTWILLGLDLSFLQVAGLVGLVLLITVRPRLRGRRPRVGPPTSTPDASSSGPPPDRTPSEAARDS
jgi:hypothetical protein